jgi:hypothetical protein
MSQGHGTSFLTESKAQYSELIQNRRQLRDKPFVSHADQYANRPRHADSETPTNATCTPIIDQDKST